MNVETFVNQRAMLALGTIAVALTPLVASGQSSGPNLLENQIRNWRPPSRNHSIRVDVNLVMVPVTVTDLMGRVVEGLRQMHFRISEDKETQEIVSFSNTDVPCSVGLLFDASSSMNDKISKARLAVRAFADTVNPADEGFLITFANQPSLQLGFTSDFAAIRNRLLWTKAKGRTALVDAVYLGLSQMRQARHSRKALVVVSDGGDNNSRYIQAELKSFAKEAEVQIYTVGIHDNPGTQEELMGTLLLEDLAQWTGGQHFIIGSIHELSDVMAQIGVLLHDQYLIGYSPQPKSMDGKWRNIKVELVLPKSFPPLQVYARRGYYPAR